MVYGTQITIVFIGFLNHLIKPFGGPTLLVSYDFSSISWESHRPVISHHHPTRYMVNFQFANCKNLPGNSCFFHIPIMCVHIITHMMFPFIELDDGKIYRNFPIFHGKNHGFL